MKVNVFNEAAVEVKEQEFFLKLVQRGKAVNLILVDENGKPVENAILLQIKPNMQLYRYACINKRLGLPLDDRDRLSLSESAD